MPEYVVTWRIDIEADSPLEAAREARAAQLDPESIGNVFEVGDPDTLAIIEQIDLVTPVTISALAAHCPVCRRASDGG